MSERRPVHWWRQVVAGLVSGILVVTLSDQPALAAAGEPGWEPPDAPELEGVEVAEIPPLRRPEFAAAAAVVEGPAAVEWPEPATENVAIPSGAAGAATADGRVEPGGAGLVRAGALPVRVGAVPVTRAEAAGAEPAPGPRQVVVTVEDRAATAAAGVNGMLMRLARRDGVRRGGPVVVEVDYSKFRHAFGGNWASRLRVVALADGGPRTLPTTHDYGAGRLAAEVPLAGNGGFTTLAVTADASGENGDYTATSLKPAATWQVSAQTGAFSWSYPLRMVPGVGGPEPSLALSYSSQAVDGLTANTNSQGSWIGDGWDLWPGYIERSYQTCAADTDDVDGDTPNNDDNPTGDRCWFSANATMSLNGSATELVKDGANTYRPVADDGSRIQRLTDTSLSNGDNNGEYWKVTTPDGTQYFFGRHRRPGYPSDTAATNSTWTNPVFGNHPGEPCYSAGDFSGSRCTQAWRWNLDYVVDPHGNSMTLFYSRETGAYGRESDPDKRTTYHRGGYLRRIEYGTRTGDEESQPVAARVVFDVADRCKPGATCSSSNPSAWPDTPWDQYCSSAPCTDQLAPTFWTQKRLSKIRAQVRRGSSFDDVESWTLRHQYLDAGATDGEGIPMWLRGITRTGHVDPAGGSEVSDPEITFDPGGMPMANRVDGPADGRTQLFRWRVQTIHTESGAEIGIGYSGHDCTRSNLPTPHTNTKRCYPQWYAPEGIEPTRDWFHKYVVTRVDVYDLTGGSPHQQTNYDYLDDPAWHYDDSELVEKKKRTWGQWRGYSKVRVRKGLDGQGPESATRYLYLRGMHGDRASPSGGTKSVSVTDSQGVSITDHEAHAGFLREETLLNGPGGGWVSGTINTPWRHGPTATSGRLKAWLTGTATERNRTKLGGGGVRWTRTDTEFDTTYGMPVEVNDRGDESTGSDNRCTRYEYARNTSKWIVDKVSRTEAVGVGCSATPNRPDDVLSDKRTFYDNQSTWGASPTRGLVVKEQEVGSWNGSSPVWVTLSRTSYDANGRPVEVFDELGRQTTTSYTPALNGPVTATQATNELGHVVASTMEPAWQLPVKTTDANGHDTELTYDGLGRLTEVWLPGRNKGSQSGNTQFEYLVRANAPSAVTTRKLLPNGGYQISIALFDGLLRERQTQTQAPGGGRAIVDTFYGERGLKEAESRDYYDTTEAPPDTTLVGPGQPQTPGITQYMYDGAERVTDEIFLALGSEAWRTSYAYGGDRTHTTPPDGGTATTTITDARDNTVALRQYHGPTPTGSYDETVYTYTDRDELASVTDAAGNTWAYTYDQRGREIETVDPDKGTTVSTYDHAGQVTTATDDRGVTLHYTYDELGRQTVVREGSATGPKLSEWVYDTLSHGIGELTKSVRYHDGALYTSEVTGYDTAGRPTGTRVIIPASETGLAGTYTTATYYWQDGSTAATLLPGMGGLPAEFLNFAYNDVGSQSWLTSSLTTYVGDVSYNKLGEVTQRVIGFEDKRTSITYEIDEPTGRLVNTSAVPQLQPAVMNMAYSYDDAGNLVRIADSPGSAVPSDTQCYEYDYLKRLTQAWTPAGTSETNCDAAPAAGSLGGAAPYWLSWTYDTIGNRLTETLHDVGGDTTTTYTHPGAAGPQPHTVTAATTTGPGGSSLDTYAYDEVGNLSERVVAGDTQVLDWDPEGNLATVTEGADVSEYVYDVDGNRLIARDPEGSTLYLPGGSELRYDNATQTATCTRYYTHLDTLVAVRTPDELTWVVTDHHNTAEVMIANADLSAEHRRTTPFGDTRGAEPAWWAGDKGFVGGTEDPTGLVHIGAREYDPTLGRFISVDPIIDVNDPQQMHGYAYGNNAPPTITDPNGMFGLDTLKNAAKSVGNTVKSTAENVGGAVASGASAVGGAVGDFAVDQWNTIKEDPLKFATEVAVGVAVGAMVAATCAAPPGVGCAVGVGIVAGMAVGAAGYGVDVSQGEREFSATDLAWEMAIGGVVGGATAGIGSALGPGLRGAGRGLANKFRRGCNSFVPGTAVVMADGSSKPIEEVELGDQVLATDSETGETTVEDVVATIVGHGDKVLVDITLEDANGDETTVTATDNHPIWVTDGDGSGTWTNAVELQRGDLLRTPDGATVNVQNVGTYVVHDVTVHNLTVVDVHTYYAGSAKQAALTHNIDEGKLCDLTLGPGPYAFEGVGLVRGRVDSGVSFRNNINGNLYGCHTCGTRNPGTTSGNWVLDHQPPTSMVPRGTPQTGYPQCRTCSNVQGGAVGQLNRGNYNFDPVARPKVTVSVPGGRMFL